MAAFVLGAVIMAIVRGKGDKSKLQEFAERLQNAQDEAKEQLEAQKKENAELQQKHKTDKAKYESLLEEARKQCKQLDEQMVSYMNGHLDEDVKAKLAEAEKLVKKIKDLEDELDEAEDDLDDAKKKLRNKESDFAELQDQFDKQTKDVKALKQDLKDAQKELEEKAEELKLKMGSLDFIQEILSAKGSSTADVKKLEENINAVKSFALNQMLDCYASLKDWISFGNSGGDNGFEEYKKVWITRFHEWASVTSKSWINGKTTIAFVGEFSAGKTSIVNRILSQDAPKAPRLPVSTKATTAIPTYIAGGPATTYQFVTPDDVLKSISEKTFTEKVSKEVLDQIHGVSSLIQYFVMTYKNANLNGMSILDTPGFNSNDKDDAERTLGVINECDALFWVFDVNSGTVNRTSINTIKEGLNKPLYVVINKVDTKPQSEVDKVENLIKKTLGEAGISVVKYIRFSAKAPLADIMTPIKEVAHLSEKDSYLDDIANELENVQNILKKYVNETKKAYDKAYKAAEKMDESLLNQLKNIQDNCKDAVEIPHFEEHLFRKDNYEMSQEEYANLDNVLGDTFTKASDVYELLGKRIDAAHDVQQAWSDHCDVENAWKRVDEMKEQYKKIRKNF